MKNRITSLFVDKSEIPLFYIESGSRLWGIASPDSDFDVRGFHLPAKTNYFDFKKQRDVWEVMDGELDFVSYDLDKMFRLLQKSNPTVFEWVRADLMYWNELPEWTTFRREVTENINFKALYYHYLSLAKSQFYKLESDQKFTYKVAFYCIRGLLSAELASRQVVPELLIDDLFKQFSTESEVIKLAKASLERKRQQTEKEEVRQADKQKIVQVIKAYLHRFESITPGGNSTQAKLERVLTNYSIQVKSMFYA